MQWYGTKAGRFTILLLLSQPQFRRAGRGGMLEHSCFLLFPGQLSRLLGKAGRWIDCFICLELKYSSDFP